MNQTSSSRRRRVSHRDRLRSLNYRLIIRRVILTAFWVAVAYAAWRYGTIPPPLVGRVAGLIWIGAVLLQAIAPIMAVAVLIGRPGWGVTLSFLAAAGWIVYCFNLPQPGPQPPPPDLYHRF